jgi:hypothetical protein
MLQNLKESTVFTFSLVVVFFRFFWFAIIALTDWLKGFAFINTWVFSFLLPKIGIIFIGHLITSLPWWLLVLLSFAPPGIVGAIFFVAFIVQFVQ